MNKLNGKVALTAFVLAAGALGSTTAGAAIVMYHDDLHQSIPERPRVEHRLVIPEPLTGPLTIVRSREECVPGGYWWEPGPHERAEAGATQGPSNSMPFSCDTK